MAVIPGVLLVAIHRRWMLFDFTARCCAMLIEKVT
jgi:hypothetical protein